MIRDIPQGIYLNPENKNLTWKVVTVTNTHECDHEKHPPQVVYKDNKSRLWSMPLSEWNALNLIKKRKKSELS